MQSSHVHHRALLADKSAVGAINRPLRMAGLFCSPERGRKVQSCHPFAEFTLAGFRASSEPIRFAQGKLREGSAERCFAAQILRYAQDDRSCAASSLRSRVTLLRACPEPCQGKLREGVTIGEAEGVKAIIGPLRPP